ncbi:RecF/RecN/SMC protein [Sistotremastrum niveocremeum HHB9708]|uniref:Structural maintenance of chromosomes protein n=2 Tax=Sistotremastraceae TaxID=3402574 RepID=A0A164XX66_9AGAM|nr:RecF/RecN/SMC protein [Sistotremastrum niveocremeum HHB9708]KZT35324.1 RecF/RecN/SMC protein [Sistotremastrum suecicum HHB10207 ss-3]
MPLKRIEVSDFKSYRGHQVIGPFTEFTSVIGPNGAGKSNLMDAISFVLGVKSAQLRSSQLKDLVYRGRRLAREQDDAVPSGAAQEDEEEGEGEGTAQKAWVMAVYEDKEKKEWTFQRTISTTANSEYKLNGKVVTYQAYNHALEGHDILVKAKNFLVFQGDVEAVASQSPQALSRLIDQISGSLELAPQYEKAKAAQERATENATFNFTKRRGIAGEIKQFKEQKSEAERFERMLEERDAAILQRILWKLFHIEDKIESNSREIVTQNKALTGLRKEQSVHDKALEKAREVQAKARSEVMSKEKVIKKAEKAVEKKRPELTEIDAQIAHADRKLKNAEKVAETVSKDIEKKEETLARFRRDLSDVQRAADEAQEASRSASSHSLSLTPESLQEYRRIKASANMEKVTERQQLESLTRQEKTTSRTLSSLNDKHAQQQERLDKLKEDGTKNAEQKQEQEINEKLAEIHNRLLQAGHDRKETEREANFKETLATLQRIFPGVRGRIVDLCKPTQRKYETAVSVVLGRNIDAVVVDLEKTAIDCIQYMREQRAGQATFIPLETIQVKPINDKFRSFAKGARLAIDVIEFEPDVERAMHHACGTALVCDTMDIARYVVYEKGQEVKAVTLEGTIIHKSGLITGGRSTHGTGKKWEEKDVQGLNRQKDSLLAQLRELSQAKPRNNSDENLVSEITRIEASLRVTKDELNGTRMRLDGIKAEIKHIEGELKAGKPELQKATAEVADLKAQIAKLSDIINASEDQIFADFCRKIGVENIREYEGRQLKVAQEENEARLRFDKQIARLTHQINFETEQLKGVQDRLESLKTTQVTEAANLQNLNQKKDGVQSDIEKADERIEELREELKALSDLLEEKTKELDEVKREANKSGKVLEKALKEIATKNDEIEKLASDRSAIYRKCRLEEIKLPLLEGRLRDVPLEETLREEIVAMDVDGEEDGTQRPKEVPDYGISVDFELLTEDERTDGSPEAGAEYDADIAKLNADIERMVPNLKAMNKLDDVEAKLAETEQEADKARKESKSAREEFNALKKQRCDMFNAAFEHISNQIDQVYKDLTKGKAAPQGGVAYLSLEDTEEPYLSGIKYHAMPPMKRFRDMEQLSGGEKTVAALALLFAIHSYRPSPFFVLDEVDAALDNTNVAKIANYIKTRASDSFQFIVISLKASLYERSNSLVGIHRDQDVNSSKTLTFDVSDTQLVWFCTPS